MSFSIEVARLGKQYERRSSRAEATLRGWLQSRLSGQGETEKFWALRDLDLTVASGEVLGIIGRNGSGKSTLLKILSRITPPTTGQAVLHGRVASLLEVGTGFHHELSGKENIYLNGAILGMSRAEINDCYQDILDFSGVGDFINTKVKNYSSGMYVRLAFSVAAHLRTDILLVDEVLAVGDAEFQERSMGKMNEVVSEQGRTILFVSHNLPLVRKLCTSCIGLNQGKLFAAGNTDDTIQAYHALLQQPSQLQLNWRGQLKDKVDNLNITINGQPAENNPAINAWTDLAFDCELHHRVELKGQLHLSIYREGVRLCTIQDRENFSALQSPAKSLFTLKGGQLRPGVYQLAYGGITEFEQGRWFYAQDVASFTITENWKNQNDKMNFGWLNLSGTGEQKSV